MIKITMGQTNRNHNGSYRKYEVEVSREVEPKASNLNKLFAIVRQSIQEQVKIDNGAGDETPNP